MTDAWITLQAGGLRETLAGLLAALPEGAVGPTVELVMSVLKATAIVLVIQLAMLYATWLERKFIARIQDRVGPNRIGLFGLGVPFADMVKILTKEDITPTAAHRWVYNLGAILVVPPALLGFAVVAFDRHLIAADLSVGILFFFAVASTSVIPIFMAGWGSRNKYALIGAMRAVAQIVSYEIPQVLSLVGVLLLAGTLGVNELIVRQGPLGDGGFPGVWFVLLQPVAFIVFLIATSAEIERTPFDIPEAESEIIAGYHTEYSGIKFGMFYLALYFATIAAAAIGAILFLGGWQPPVAALGFVPGWVWMTAKTVLLVLVFMWLRGTLPRLRADQLMAFAWKILVPLTLANLLLTGLLGKALYDAQQPPIVVFGAFAAGNAVLLGLLVWLIAWWRRRDDAVAVAFDAPLAPSGRSA